MGKPKAPRPPDPRQTAAAQTGTNIATAIAQQQMNLVNQRTPYGDLTYSQTGSYTYTDPLTGKSHVMPRYTATQTLAPAQQRMLAENNRAGINLAQLAADQSGRLGGLLSRPFDADGLPAAGDPDQIRPVNLQRPGAVPEMHSGFADAGPLTRSYGTDFSEDRQRVEDALMARLTPRLDRDRRRLETRLAGQGIRMGSEAYKTAFDDLDRAANDARLGVIMRAGEEQSRLTDMEARRAGFQNAAQAQAYGQAATRAGFANQAGQQTWLNRMQGIRMGNQAAVQEAGSDINRLRAANAARNQALNERFAIRNQPLNEILALLQGGQVRMPRFVDTPVTNLPTTDFAGIQANYDQAMQDRYQQQMAGWHNMWGGAFGLATNWMKSDRRLKRDIKRVGRTDDGQPIYRFRYKTGGPIQMGLMAQDVEKRKPEAVARVGRYKAVNYGIALGR